jgi:hypothetical protein
VVEIIHGSRELNVTTELLYYDFNVSHPVVLQVKGKQGKINSG